MAVAREIIFSARSSFFASRGRGAAALTAASMAALQRFTSTSSAASSSSAASPPARSHPVSVASSSAAPCFPSGASSSWEGPPWSHCVAVPPAREASRSTAEALRPPARASSPVLRRWGRGYHAEPGSSAAAVSPAAAPPPSRSLLQVDALAASDVPEESSHEVALLTLKK